MLAVTNIKQSMKCQALRVIIIDEVSMISAELFGALEYVVKGAVRAHGTYETLVLYYLAPFCFNVFGCF